MRAVHYANYWPVRRYLSDGRRTVLATTRAAGVLGRRRGERVVGFRVKMVSEGDLPTGVGWAAVRDGQDRWLFVDGVTYSGGIPPAAITAVMRLRYSSSSSAPTPVNA